MAADQLVHLKHVDRVLLEDCLHPLVTAYLAFVLRLLQVIGLDVLPQLLDNLRSGQLRSQVSSMSTSGTKDAADRTYLVRADEVREGVAQIEFFLKATARLALFDCA